MSRQDDRFGASLHCSHRIAGTKRRAEGGAVDHAGQASHAWIDPQAVHVHSGDARLSRPDSASSTSPAATCTRTMSSSEVAHAHHQDNQVEDEDWEHHNVNTNMMTDKIRNKTSSKRPRAPMSCTECRKSKIRCDRNVPRCSSCVRRGVPYLCRWGDARDDLPPIQQHQQSPVASTSASKSATPHHTADASTCLNDSTTEHAHTTESSASHDSSRDSLHARIQRIEASLALDAAVASPRSTSSLSRPGSMDCRTRALALLPSSTVLRSLLAFYFVHVEPGVDVLATQSCFFRQIQPLITRSQRVKATLGLANSNLMATIKALPPRADSHPATDIGGKPASTTSDAVTPSAPATDDDAIPSADFHPDGIWQELDLVALVLLLLQGCFDHLTIKELQGHGLDIASQPDLDRASQVYRDAALELVRLDSRLETPTLTLLQAVVCMRHYYLHRGRHRTYATFNTLAIRLAIQMGLHRLGSLEQDLANAELLEQSIAAAAMSAAASSSSSSQHASNLWGLFLPTTQHRRWLDTLYAKFAPNDLVLRELGRKVWHVLVCMDWFQASHYDGFYSVHPGSFTTALPINLSQNHIESALMSGTLPRPLPRDHPTEASFLPVLAALAQCSLKLADAANEGRSSYADLCTIETQLRTILEQLPPFYRLDGQCENLASVQAFHREIPRLTFQRLLINETIHHRILKIHRLYLLVGLQSRAFEPSAKACISSSLRLVELVAMADARSWPGLRYWHLKLHLTDALSNLAVVLIHRAGQSETSETRHYRSCLDRGIQILRNGIMTPYLRASIQVIRALAKAELTQRGRRGKRNATPTATHQHSRHLLSNASYDNAKIAADNRQDFDQASARIGLVADSVEEAGNPNSMTRTVIADATATPPSIAASRAVQQAPDDNSQRSSSSIHSPNWQLATTSFLEPGTTAASRLSSDEVSHSSAAEIDIDDFVSSVLPGDTFGFWQPHRVPDMTTAAAAIAPPEMLPDDSDAHWSDMANQVDWTDVLARITAATAQTSQSHFAHTPFTRLD